MIYLNYNDRGSIYTPRTLSLSSSVNSDSSVLSPISLCSKFVFK